MAPGLLEVLCCPETHQSVRLAEAELIARLNTQIAAGNVLNRSGQSVTLPLNAGLLRADGAFLYPVRNEIPVMMIGEAIPLAALKE